MTTFDGQRQAAQRLGHIGPYLGPEESRIGLGDVGRGGVAELRIDADLGELVEQRVELARIKRIGKLPDEIGRPDKPASVQVS